MPKENYEMLHEFRHDFNDKILHSPKIEFQLTSNNLLNKHILEKVDRLLMVISERKMHNLLVKVTFHENSSYESFVSCYNLAEKNQIECFVRVGNDFYYYNCD